jgi:hypothetical protein
MYKYIKCLLFGHKKFETNVLNGNDIILVSDALNQPLVSINVCKNCGKVYSTFL